ncbi:MAG: GNAT family N-acetyltransferase [Candidatus Pacebacteria bacterium]|nr:GNAT family N-acetyltransferase [Candidatus Paceibacterota bacterium]
MYFYKLAVLKTNRNKGVGKLLINQVEAVAKRKGIVKILLECMQEKELPEYYKKFGYRIDKVKRHQGHHDVYMSKKIEI